MGLSLRDSREGNAGLRRAVGLVWPRAAIQWCWVHKLHFHRIVYAAVIDAARVAYTAFERKWRQRCPGVARSLAEGGEELLTFFSFPRAQWKTLRTTNAIERLNEEFRRRVKTQGSLPSEEAALILLFGLIATGQIKLRKIDGYRKLAGVLSEQMRRAA